MAQVASSVPSKGLLADDDIDPSDLEGDDNDDDGADGPTDEELLGLAPRTLSSSSSRLPSSVTPSPSPAANATTAAAVTSSSSSSQAASLASSSSGVASSSRPVASIPLSSSIIASTTGDDEDEGEEGEEEGDDAEGDAEGDEEEEEPKLKYQRLGASVTGILKDDVAKCLVAHDKFLVLGTAKGFVHVLDLNGNEIMKLESHTAEVNDLSMDSSGDFVASCSNDGTVVVSNLFSRESTKHAYHRPVLSVALPANYKASQMFATGGLTQQLVINTKGWFNNKDNIIHSGEGPIYGVSWRSDLIAWANGLGIKIYDTNTSERITYINRTAGAPHPNLYQCCLCWAKDDTLLMGWADSVKIGVVKERKGPKTRPDQPNRFMQIIAMFQTDFMICGIAPFDDHLVLLAYVEDAEEKDDAKRAIEGKVSSPSAARRHDDDADGKAQRPELRVMSWSGTEEVSSDALPIAGYENYAATDYRFDYVQQPGAEPLFYIVSPKDIVVARPRDVDDHITWLLQHDRYQQALEAAQANPTLLKQHKLLDIGERFLKHLFERKEFAKAASYCPQLLQTNAPLWEAWIMLFAKHRQIKVISAYIPTSSPQLSDTIYEMVLNYFLVEDYVGFLRLVREWNHHIYNIANVITAVRHGLAQLEQKGIALDSRQPISSSSSSVTSSSSLSSSSDGKDVRVEPRGNDHRVLMEALAELYLLSKQHPEALHVYLKLGKEDVFRLVKDLGLFEAVRDKVRELMIFDSARAVDMFINNLDRIPVQDVVAQLEREPKLLHEYLHALFKKDVIAGSKFHELQIELYAQYDPARLLPFLRNSNHYTLEVALQTCQRNKLYNEMVFIYRRMGNPDAALRLIIENLNDVQQAIAFVEEHKDELLWEELIQRSLKSPDFLSNLLEHVGSHYVDLVKLINRIPANLDIPSLKYKLIKIMSDCTLQGSVRTGCNTILKRDCISLQQRLYIRAKKAMRVEMGVQCTHCDGEIFVGRLDSVVVFFCRHAYHASCLEQQRIDVHSSPMCPKCNVGRPRGARARGPTYTGSGTRRPAAAVTASAAAATSSSSSSNNNGTSGASTVVSIDRVVSHQRAVAAHMAENGPDRLPSSRTAGAVGGGGSGSTNSSSGAISSPSGYDKDRDSSSSNSGGAGGPSFSLSNATSGRLATAPDRSSHMRTGSAIPSLASSGGGAHGTRGGTAVGTATTPRATRRT